MYLVADLIAETVDSATNLGQILRKAKVLASEFRSPELEAWAEFELNGYDNESDVPDYRVSTASNGGRFIGIGGRQALLSIPLSSLPEDWQDPMSTLEFRQGIAGLPVMSDSSDEYTEEWPSDFMRAVSTDIY